VHGERQTDRRDDTEQLHVSTTSPAWKRQRDFRRNHALAMPIRRCCGELDDAAAQLRSQAVRFYVRRRIETETENVRISSRLLRSLEHDTAVTQSDRQQDEPRSAAFDKGRGSIGRYFIW
jgi:hypothetical protein